MKPEAAARSVPLVRWHCQTKRIWWRFSRLVRTKGRILRLPGRRVLSCRGEARSRKFGLTTPDPALSQQLLDVAEAQGEAEIEPHRMADDVGREPVTLKRDRTHSNACPPNGPQAEKWRQFSVCLTAPRSTPIRPPFVFGPLLRQPVLHHHRSRVSIDETLPIQMIGVDNRGRLVCSSLVSAIVEQPAVV
jgi:hypothetical protein